MSGVLAPSVLRLAPGAAVSIAGERAPLAQRLLQGRRAEQAPQLLGSLYALCGHAHRVCAQSALAALALPQGAAGFLNQSQRLALWRETLREHVRRLALDWPRLLGANAATTAQALAGAASCPALKADVLPLDSALDGWLAEHIFGMAPKQWLAACQQSPSEGLIKWTHETTTWPAQLLHAALPWASRWHAPMHALQLDAAEPVLRQLAAAMQADADFSSLPLLSVQVLETGCWSRAGGRSWPVADVWTRLAARLTDLAQLALDPDGRWLRSGALSLGNGQALAWCEMARGVLVHWLQVDAQGRVERYSVLAPTEWNFHPQGPVAQVLRRLPGWVNPQEVAPAVATLVAAFDPCVAYALEEPHYA